MKHIFFIHSNIAVISTYDTIKELVRRKENVVVLLTRGTKWQFSKDNIQVIDITKLSMFYYTKTPHIRTIRDCLLAKKILKRLKLFVEKVVAGSDFTMYIPHYHSVIISSFCENIRCKGYYFFEEGTLSYRSIENIKQVMGYQNKYRIISRMIGVPYYFAYHINEKMQGTIAISDEAFPWYNGKKIITPFHYNNEIISDNDYSIRRNIIVMPPLTSNMKELISLTDGLLNFLTKTSELSIALKFHPRTGEEEGDNLSIIMKVIEKYEVTILPSSYVIEYNLMQEKSVIYSIKEKSSLLLYSFLLGGKSFFVYCNNKGLEINELNSINSIVY